MMEISDDIVEGIGNEVLLLTAAAITILVMVCALWRPWEQPPPPPPPGAPQRVYDSAGACPVCLSSPIERTLRTNCGHGFCAACLETWAQRTLAVTGRAMECPICRRKVNMVHIEFEPSAADAASERFATQYNSRHSDQPRSLFQMIRDAPYLLRRFWHEVSDLHNLRRNMLWLKLLRVVVVLASIVVYVLSPFDLVPEAVFGVLGLLDDVAVCCVFLVVAASVYRRILLEREARREG